jgi:uncharacterized protein YpmB
MRFPHGPGFGMFGGILESIIAGLFFLVCLVVIVGLLFILVRFLLVATKAAEVYVAKNSPAHSTDEDAADRLAEEAAQQRARTLEVLAHCLGRAVRIAGENRENDGFVLLV